jgi:hypothetical protein
MGFTVDDLARLALQKKSWDDCSLQELQQIASTYPYYKPVHLLLAKKLQGHNGRLQNQVSLASLYFPDPAWFDHLLNDKGSVSINRMEKHESIKPFEPSFTPERTVAVAEMHKAEEKAYEEARSQGIKNIGAAEDFSEIENEMPSGSSTGETNNNREENFQALPTVTKEPEITNSTIERSTEPFESGPVEESLDMEETAKDVAPEFPLKENVAVQEEENILAPNEVMNEPEVSFSKVDRNTEPFQSGPVEESLDIEDTDKHISPELPVAENNTVVDEEVKETLREAEVELNNIKINSEDNTVTVTEQNKEEEKINPAREKHEAETILSVSSPALPEIVFEPFHTVDYFASQGIRFSEEEKPKDKFGQQLKSFTEWLKTMKKTPPAAVVESQPADQKVEKLAAVSIADRAVVTEAMAEVWEKQGNQAKALEIYEKLSLLNPSKRAYFAAKIEHLKNLT